jgi:hypothetical protein
VLLFVLASNCAPPTFASEVAEIAGMYHHTQMFLTRRTGERAHSRQNNIGRITEKRELKKRMPGSVHVPVSALSCICVRQSQRL